MGITRGRYTRNFYILPTLLIHNGGGFYVTLEFAWLKWYWGFIWHNPEVEEIYDRLNNEKKEVSNEDGTKS